MAALRFELGTSYMPVLYSIPHTALPLRTISYWGFEWLMDVLVKPVMEPAGSPVGDVSGPTDAG